MKKLLFSLILLLSISMIPNKSFAWEITGIMTYDNSSLDVPECENNGTIILRHTTDLKFDEFTGNGKISIQSGRHALTSKNFLFKGTIEINNNCELNIYTSIPSEDLKFTIKGNGKINILSLDENSI